MNYRQQIPMGMQQWPMGMPQMPMGTQQQPMEFHPQFTEEQGAAPQQFFPGFPGGGSSTNRRLDELERQMERLNRQVERLDRRVSRIERRLGFNRAEQYDLPSHPDYY